MKDIVCAEAELSVAANQIANYANCLATSIEQYSNVLADIWSHGIVDEQVRVRLNLLKFRVLAHKKILAEQGDEIQKAIKSYIDNIAQADNFKFPEDPSSEISRLLAQFV